MNTTKIVKSVDFDEFNRIISDYETRIKVGPHALDHLSNAQRGLFKEQEVVNILVRQAPKGIGLQRNGRYAAFFKRKIGYMKIIFELKKDRLEIITFINTDSLPNIKRLDDEK